MLENHIDIDGEECFDEEGAFEREESLLYFGGLFRREESDRLKFINHFSKSVKTWISKPDDFTAQSMLQAHVPTALRLSINAPYQDVRDGLSELLKEIQELGYEVPKPAFTGPSSFIPQDEMVTYGSKLLQNKLDQAQSLYEDVFVYSGRLSHMTQLLGYHPSYLVLYVKAHDFLMHGNGPLPLHIRNYLAILGASRHKCSYLISIQETEFLKNNGDKQWLKGIQFLPKKLQNLLCLNKLLAHQPWLVKPGHMKDLLVGTDSWSMSELVHAITILANYHALAGFCLGCGINPEIDTSIGHTPSAGRNGDTPHLHGQQYNPALGMGRRTPSDSESETMSPLGRSPLAPSPPQNIGTYIVQHYIATANQDSGPMREVAPSLRETLKSMENEQSSGDDEENDEQNKLMFEKAASSAGMDMQRPKFPTPMPVNLVKYIDDPDFEHEDFALTSVPTLRAREYSWEDHGFPLLSSLYPDIGPILDEKFKVAFHLTYRMIGSEKDIDTKPFREATWYYIHSIKGIRHDDYHYRKVNQVLSITFKTYIRMVGCFPERVSCYDFINCIPGLQYSEKIHINILVLEARLQAELIYALRAIMNYMK